MSIGENIQCDILCVASLMCVILGSFIPYAFIGLILLHYRQPQGGRFTCCTQSLFELEIKSNLEKQWNM